jgi:drug/metabolite transporter (DMT)-like permease
LVTRLVTLLFVLIWSTGWVSVGFAIPHAGAFSFLAVRFGLAALIIGIFAFAVGARWPQGLAAWSRAIFCGVLTQGLYLMGIWWAVEQGLPAGISGLIAALQPLLTALLAARIAGEALRRAQWFGIGIGFCGVLLVLEPKIAAAFTANGTGHLLWPIIANIAGMVSVTLGTLFQKRYLQHEDLRSLTAIQAFGGFLPMAVMLLFVSPWRFEWRMETMLTLGWTIFGLSCAGTAFLLYLIRKGEVAKVSSLIFLMPPLVAIEAYLLLGEKLLPTQIAGMAVVSVGVYLAVRTPQRIETASA